VRKEEFLRKIVPAARQEMQQSGILASVLVAQAIVASKWGDHALGNNLFGVKDGCLQNSTLEFRNGRWTRVLESFRVYADWSASVRDYAKSMSESLPYRELLYEPDYRKACLILQEAGCAMDANYADKLINLIEANHLNQYDSLAVDEIVQGAPGHYEVQNM